MFYTLSCGFLALGLLLMLNIPPDAPYGGPDEPMHVAMIQHIARHLAWPHWDADDILRCPHGGGYTSGSSIVYWFHALAYKLYGHPRVGPFFLLAAYLSMAGAIFLRNRSAGWFLLAMLLPQTVFVFSYVNSDSGTVFTALALGFAIAYFLSNPTVPRRLYLLFFSAGFCVTARQHMWPVAFAALVLVIAGSWRSVLTYRLRHWAAALLLALLGGAWWFLTSFVANDGDCLGFATMGRSSAVFGDPSVPAAHIPLSRFPFADFLSSTAKSLYAVFGWMNIRLMDHHYFIPFTILIVLSLAVRRIVGLKPFLAGCLLLAVNPALLVYCAVTSMYQAQGRYLFPAVYLLAGAVTGRLLSRKEEAKVVARISLVLSIVNLVFLAGLARHQYIPLFQR